jgi:hypothetical protein
MGPHLISLTQHAYRSSRPEQNPRPNPTQWVIWPDVQQLPAL